MSGWRDAPVVEAAPAWASAPEVEPPPRREASSRTDRFVTGLMDPVIGAAQIADRAINPIRQWISPGASSMEDVVKQRDAEYVAPEGVDWMRMAGGVAPSLVTGGVGGLAGKALPAAAARLAPQAGMSAVRGGAVQAALGPTEAGLDLEEFAKQKGIQAGVGAAAGGVLSKVLPRAMGGLIKPTDEARALQRAGIDVTPGQAIGGKASEWEQKATSIPVLGDFVSKARGRTLDDFQEAVLHRNVVGLPKGIKTVDDANDFVSEMYEKAVPFIKATPESKANVRQALTDALANPELIDSHRKILEGIHRTRFANYDDLSGAALKRLDSELGHLARKYKGPTAAPSDKVLADEIYNLQRGMREGWVAGMPEDKAYELAMANDAYRLLVPVNKASSARADERVMPRALQKAIAKQAGRDVSRMDRDDFVGKAVRVLPDKVPDSGTAGRLALPAAVIGGLAAPGLALKTLAGALVAAGAYSRPGVNVITGNTAVQRQLEKMEPATRNALIAAIRSQQSGHEPKGE